ncbi:MAG TPA: hypothetical protein VFY60_18520 [Pyrinomonadaceae bacterium]|nr:hypothetical protein [Pyrinomonadaceae bacterium]
MVKRYSAVLNCLSLVCLLVLPVLTPAQTTEKKSQAKASVKEISNANETDSLEKQRRSFAISLVTSLADEARTSHDPALRPKVLSRAADILWDADNDTARLLFRRAWEAAEVGDAESLALKTQDDAPPMVTALRRISRYDLRSSVLYLVARRDRTLADEFLKKLVEEKRSESDDSRNDPGPQNRNDSWEISESASRRFQLAAQLLEDGKVELALELVAPFLDKVNVNSVGFLSSLRLKKQDAADQRFAFLLARAEFDSSSDANTASVLSSYVFTPGLYVTFSPDGNARWIQPTQPTAAVNVSVALRNKFFQAAASILMRPLPPPDQDFTSSGRTGKYMVIKRLLPLFDQYAPDTALGLRTQLTTLAGEGSINVTGHNNNPLLNQGLQPEETTANASEKMQERLDYAKSSQERDSIYAEAAVAMASQGEARSQDVADRIDNSDLRARVRRYVDFELVRFAIRKKEVAAVERLANSGQFNHTERAWAYTEAARMLTNSQRSRSLEFLQMAADEARRIDREDPDRARSLIGVATQLISADRVRAWELMSEVVKAANSTEKFTGENVQFRVPLMTKDGLKLISIGGEDFGLSGIIRSLAKDDLYRSIDLAKSFKNELPRATAILAIASAVLEK